MLFTPEQIERLETTKALKQYSDHIQKHPTINPVVPFFRRLEPAWGLAIAASLIVAGIIGIWFIRSNSLEKEVASLNSTNSQQQSDFPIQLPAVRVRSTTVDTQLDVAIPAGSTVSQIRMPPANSYKDYQTTLVREPDLTLFSLNGLKPIDSDTDKLLIVRVPSRILVSGEYRLVLRGTTVDGNVENVGSYIFRVVGPSTP
jgi:hypothetical protein